MTEYVSMSRDDAYWLLAEAWPTTNIISDQARAKLENINKYLDAQPRREGRPEDDPSSFDIFVVQVEYTEGSPIAVRTTPDAAFEIARVFNLAGGATASVRGYRFDGVGDGTALEIPGS
jgi:hypothetical protein